MKLSLSYMKELRPTLYTDADLLCKVVEIRLHKRFNESGATRFVSLNLQSVPELTCDADV